MPVFFIGCYSIEKMKCGAGSWSALATFALLMLQLQAVYSSQEFTCPAITGLGKIIIVWVATVTPYVIRATV
jgi:hypothetical protein